MIPRFRAWHRELGRMMLIKNMWFQDDKVEELELNDTVMNDYITAYPDEIELMQSTGVKDRNSVEIFEGDILEIQGIRMIVKFGSYEYVESSKSNGHTLGVVYDGLGFYVECINAADPDRISPFEPETLKNSQIIGNIYENPELLEDK